MKFLKNLERRFGRYAVPNLTRYIILTYVIGYILSWVGSATGTQLTAYLMLDPAMIFRGQIWRIFTWVLMPPSEFTIWTIIMLYLYYQLGTALESAWGDFLYNFYIFFGLAMTVAGALVSYLLIPQVRAVFDWSSAMGYPMMSTYYVSLSIFLGFAMTFPNQQLLLMFIIPIKIKYLAAVEVVFLVYRVIASGGNPAIVIMIICSLASTVLFFLASRNYSRFDPKERRRQREFREAMGESQRRRFAGGSDRYGRRGAAGSTGGSGTKIIAKHKCAICGRTELDDPSLEFRFCSKCSGNYEYCNEHLFSHRHVE